MTRKRSVRFGTLFLLWVAIGLAAMTAHAALAEDAQPAQTVAADVQLRTALEDVLNLVG
jgi:hypothetical protein